MRHRLYVDAGFRNGEGKVAWFNETTLESSYRKRLNCKDSFRCEYAGVLYALEHCRGITKGDEVEVIMDNKVVVGQLMRESAINDEDVLRQALKIWNWGKRGEHNLTFSWVPRKENKAGKLLGS